MARQAKAASDRDPDTLLDIRNLRIEATVYPPVLAPRNVVIVDVV
jgi:peptide/nickel transport system ATP-binding protein